MTPWAAKCAACWDEPHWRSTVVPTTDSGKPGGEGGVAADVDRLVADLHDAAHDHVLDQGGVELVALDERTERVGGEVDGVGVLELAVPASEGGADGVDDDCGGHWGLLELATRPGGQLYRQGYRPGPCPATWTTPSATAACPCSAQLGLSFDGYGEGWATADLDPDRAGVQPAGRGARRRVRRDPRRRHELRHQRRARVGRPGRARSTSSTRRCAPPRRATRWRCGARSCGSPARSPTWSRGCATPTGELVSRGTGTFFVRRKER